MKSEESLEKTGQEKSLLYLETVIQKENVNMPITTEKSHKKTERLPHNLAMSNC
jgi:hypothetical protein